MLRFPVESAEQPDEVILQNVALLVLVQLVENSLQHVLVYHEA